MPRTDIDYSNTVFYKIYCKDINFHDVYIGHTTNFVQRKHAHKRACNKSTDQSHNFKVYKIIREHGGWDNWNMEMIGFKNCKDHSEACTVEQEYFDSYEASLNSILAKKSIIERLPIAKEKLNLYCEVCKINSSCTKSFERHKKTKKHESLVNAQENAERSTTPEEKSEIKFNCEICDYKCCYESDFNRHKMTAKHKIPKVYICKLCDYKTSNMKDYNKHNNTLKHINRTNRTEKVPKQYVCECGKAYSARNSLWYHKKVCKPIEQQDEPNNLVNESVILSNEHQNQSEDVSELCKIVREQQEQIHAQQKQIQDLIPQLQQVTNNTNCNNKFNLK